jgi:hypothetical protein
LLLFGGWWQTIHLYPGSDLNPAFAQPSLAAGQRIGDQHEDYSVVCNTEDGQKTYSPSDFSEFSRFQIGTSWTLSLNAVGGVLDVKP